VAGVAATEMEVVEAGQVVKGLHGAGHALVPRVGADPLAGCIAEILVVGLTVVQRMMGDLQVRGELPVVEQRGAEPGAQGGHQL